MMDYKYRYIVDDEANLSSFKVASEQIKQLLPSFNYGEPFDPYRVEGVTLHQLFTSTNGEDGILLIFDDLFDTVQIHSTFEIKNAPWRFSPI